MHRAGAPLATEVLVEEKAQHRPGATALYGSGEFALERERLLDGC